MQRRPDVLWREIDGSVVGLDLRSSRYFTLNGTGLLLWKRLAEEAEVDDLVDELVRQHDLEHERARTDVEMFVSSLRDNGLLAP